MSLRTVRFFKKMSQWDIAKITGIPQSKVSLIERGYIKPKEQEIEKFVKALNCEREELIIEPDQKSN